MNQNFTKNDIQEARRLDEKCVKNRILEIIVQRMVLDLDFCFALKTWKKSHIGPSPTRLLWFEVDLQKDINKLEQAFPKDIGGWRENVYE